MAALSEVPYQHIFIKAIVLSICGYATAEMHINLIQLWVILLVGNFSYDNVMVKCISNVQHCI